MKVYYLNDEQKPITLRILDANYDDVNATGDTYLTLQSCQGVELDIELPPDSILYIKKWPNMVMISYTSPSVQSLSGQSRQLKDDV